MPQELDAFQAKTVAKGQAAGDATREAWRTEHSGQVIYVMYPLHRAVAGQVDCVPPGTALACARLVLTCEHAAGAQHVSSQDCGAGPSGTRGMEEFMAWRGTREQEHGIEQGDRDNVCDKH